MFCKHTIQKILKNQGGVWTSPNLSPFKYASGWLGVRTCTTWRVFGQDSKS